MRNADPPIADCGLGIADWKTGGKTGRLRIEKNPDRLGRSLLPFTSMLTDPLQNITIVLVRPQFAGNIGSVCRAMKNTGLFRLILVSPEQDPLSGEARMMATSAKDILQKAKIFSSLEEALEGFRWIAGTSARKGITAGPSSRPAKFLQRSSSTPVPFPWPFSSGPRTGA